MNLLNFVKSRVRTNPPDDGSSLQELGDTKIYLAEVQTIVQALNLKYGIITRTDPLRWAVHSTQILKIVSLLLSSSTALTLDLISSDSW